MVPAPLPARAAAPFHDMPSDDELRRIAAGAGGRPLCPRWAARLAVIGPAPPAPEGVRGAPAPVVPYRARVLELRGVSWK